MSGSVSGLNPAIYAQVGQGVTPLNNPLTQYAQTLQTTNSLLGIRAQQAKQAAGQAFQASINPDGTTNQTALLQNLAANPAAAMSAQDSAQAGQTLSTGEYAQHMARLNYGASGAVQLLTAPGGPTLPAVKAYYDQAVQDGHVTPQDEQSVLAGFTADPNQNRQVILQRLQQNVGAQQALTNAVGSQTSVDNGPNIQPGMTGGITGAAPGAFTPAGPAVQKGFAPTLQPTGGGTTPLINGAPAGPVIPNTPSPGDQNALVSTFNPVTRQMEYKPRAVVAPMVNGNGQPTPTSMTPGLPQSGRVAPAAPGAPAASAAPPPQPNVAQPALGAPEEIAGAVAHAVAARNDANTYTQRITPLMQAQAALQTADTGKMGDTLNTVRSYIQNVPSQFLRDSFPDALNDPAKVAAYDEANKYLTAFANQSPGASGSDARTASAQAANASVHISPLAAKMVVQAAIGQQRMTQAGTLAFNQSGQPAANYDQFMNQWNTQQDPRGYIADQMTPAERAAAVKSMGGTSSPAYQKFKASYQAGVNTQVVPSHGY